MTPSCVAFTSDGIVLVGEAAKDQQARNPTNTFFAVKRLIGRRFSDKSIKKEIKNWPFKVIADAYDKPVIHVELGREDKRYSPEAISAEILIHMRKMAEAFLGHPVADAVITIPANFGDAQRQSTCEAARMAGINVLRLLNEPTAAAVAYGFENVTSVSSTKNILVFDLGGGTLDVSILSVSKENLFEVKATAGNMHLGGEDFDNILVNHFADEFKRKSKSNLLLDKKAVRRLSAACERAKRSLSQNLIGTVEIDCLHKGQDFQGKMDRAKFEALCGELFLKAMLPVAEALRNAKLIKADEIVLSGGSSRIPMVRKLLRDYFDGKQLNEKIDPEEAVAYEAAIMAAKLSGGSESSADIRNMKLVDITSQSLGGEDSDGNMVVEIPQGTRLPCKRSRDWTTTVDDQTDYDVCIYEGEHKKAKRNIYLGCLELVDLPRKPKGELRISKTMEIDENGILHVSAVERSTGKAKISFTRRFGLSHGI